MSDTYIIEVRSQAAGIVVRDHEGYRFFAASHRFNPIEGQVFRNAREAERAALRIANGGWWRNTSTLTEGSHLLQPRGAPAR
jgi:hypothetical protein